MTYRVIASTETDPDSPVTSTLMIALDENLDATAAGELNAPKLALKSLIGSFTTGNLDFNNLGAFSGVWFELVGRSTDVNNNRFIRFDATVDGGANYLGSVPILSFLQNTGSGSATGFFDFATGLVHGVINLNQSSVITFSQTIAGASLAINGIRFIGENTVNGAVLIHPNGGESAT